MSLAMAPHAEASCKVTAHRPRTACMKNAPRAQAVTKLGRTQFFRTMHQKKSAQENDSAGRHLPRCRFLEVQQHFDRKSEQAYVWGFYPLRSPVYSPRELPAQGTGPRATLAEPRCLTTISLTRTAPACQRPTNPPAALWQWQLVHPPDHQCESMLQPAGVSISLVAVPLVVELPARTRTHRFPPPGTRVIQRGSRPHGPHASVPTHRRDAGLVVRKGKNPFPPRILFLSERLP